MQRSTQRIQCGTVELRDLTIGREWMIPVEQDDAAAIAAIAIAAVGCCHIPTCGCCILGTWRGCCRSHSSDGCMRQA